MNLLIDEIQRRYDLALYRNERRLKERTAAVYAAVPQIRELDERVFALRRQLLLRPADAGALQDEIDQMHYQEKQLLEQNGFDADYLEPVYECALCRDTGIDPETGRRCVCFEQKLLHERYKTLHIDENASFERFDGARFPDDRTYNGITQRQAILEIKKRCEKYADAYPDNSKKNIVFIGPSGLGKTFLLHCIARRITERGRVCLVFSAYKLFDIFLKYHLGEADGLSGLYEAPALAVDDLGTEPLMKNVTSEYFFMLLNERMKKGLHTLFATNFSPAGLADRYGERILSRLLSARDADIYPFEGEDIRSLRT